MITVSNIRLKRPDAADVALFVKPRPKMMIKGHDYLWGTVGGD
jgi:hypothetical protein